MVNMKSQIDVSNEKIRRLSKDIKDAINKAGYDARLLSSSSKQREIADLRKVYVILMYSNTVISLRVLASQLNMTHSAVLKAYNQAHDLYKTDEKFKELITLIMTLMTEKCEITWW